MQKLTHNLPCNFNDSDLIYDSESIYLKSRIKVTLNSTQYIHVNVIQFTKYKIEFMNCSFCFFRRVAQFMK